MIDHITVILIQSFSGLCQGVVNSFILPIFKCAHAFYNLCRVNYINKTVLADKNKNGHHSL